MKKAPEPKGSEITPPDLYANRRRFLQIAGAAAGTAAAAWAFRSLIPPPRPRPKIVVAPGADLSRKRAGAPAGETATAYEDIAGYNNYYEFSTDKYEVAALAAKYKVPAPWTVEVGGECAKPGTIGLEDLVKLAPPEERVYRMRCVEGWSMVIPWLAAPLGTILARFQPTSNAKYVAFTSLEDPKMPGVPEGTLDWPYVEGLRMDEAMHPLTVLATGIYGQPLLPQNGAPLRLVVPWKYGFKGIKAIVQIQFVRELPPTTWHKAGPDEYGFYSNVNPNVDHPRWSQARERRIGETGKRKTLLFNGYADEVAPLYAGMDLEKWF